MLASTVKNRRLLEATQFVLSFVSVCAVVEASQIETASPERPGYYATVPHEAERSADRRVADLGRSERKRRESEQLASRRGLELVQSQAMTSRRRSL
jgi:hypothetical protein